LLFSEPILSAVLLLCDLPHRHNKSEVLIYQHLHANPDNGDYYVEAFALAALVLVAPHAVLFVVPVGASSRVHASSASKALVGTCIFRRRGGACADAIFPVGGHRDLLAQ